MGGKFSFPNQGRFVRESVTKEWNKNSHAIALNEFFEATSLSAPVISLISSSSNIISDEVGKTTCSVVFHSNVSCDQWEARAGGSGQGGGLLVGSGGAINANTDTSFDVTYDELTEGDKTYRINVYGHNTAGWTIYG